MPDIETIREQHKYCVEVRCHFYSPLVDAQAKVPCHVTTVLAALDKERERARNKDIAVLEAAVARADADRLAKALEDANASLGGCTPTSGGTDGRWCATHLDYRWLDEMHQCELTVAISAALRQHDDA